jgi:DNA helicase IV
LAEVNDVRVYPISVVKGMEFDVVFFHNIDNGHFSEELTRRYVYVGLSRAAFFLASTSNQYNSSLSKYFELNTDWAKII